VNIPDSMNAVLLTGHGGMEKLEFVENYPIPTVADDEVLVEVRACGMNNTDVWVREGAYGKDDDPDAISSWRREGDSLTFPRIQGADIAGRIVDVGKNIDTTRIGERVMVDFSIYNTDGDSLADIDYIGHGRDGGYAEYCAVPADHAYQVTNNMSDAELATFCCAYLTAEHMLNRAAVVAGERVLVTGASGGVGGALIQLCRIRGAIPYAVTSESKIDRVRQLGAEGVFIRGQEDFVNSVKTAMDDKGFDVVADVVAGAMFQDLINLLRPEGRYTTAGAFAGPMVQLDLRTVYLKHLQIHGSSQGSRGAFKDLLGYINDGRLSANLDATYKLSDIHRAQQDFMQKKHIGKLVVIPDRFYSETGLHA
jgi:alcohol dehydrogenase